MVQKTYGISAEQYADLLRLQGGRCAICGVKPKSKRLAVDHDHRTGAVRGLLCAGDKGCNSRLLGGAHDSIAMLAAAWHYLNTPPMDGNWTPIAEQAALVPDSVKTAPPREEGAPSVRDFTVPSATDNAEEQAACIGTHYLPAGAVSDPAGDGYFRVYVRDGVELAPPF